MIFDLLANAKSYEKTHSRLAKGLKYLSRCDFSTMKDGRYDIDNSDLYMNITTYETHNLEEAMIEAHKNYIDIQYIISGKELVGWASLSTMDVLVKSYPDTDMYFYNGNINMLPLSAGYFMVFFPQDVHAPCLHFENEATVRKAVVKVRIE